MSFQNPEFVERMLQLRREKLGSRNLLPPSRDGLVGELKHPTIPGLVTGWVEITEAKAIGWLDYNVHNRKLNQGKIASFARQHMNGDFVNTHQGIAFNDANELVDGQHTLKMVILTGKPVWRMVTFGLPKVPAGKNFATMDVIDAAGNVITRADRTLDVWRGVPTIENVAITAPYQLDGRISNLRDQAQAAISSHSQGPLEPTAILDDIARFERTQVSSPRALFVIALAELGVPLDQIPIPERAMHLTAAQRHGRDIFERACARCHGSATTNTIVDRTVHDALFFALAPDGTVIYDIVGGQPVPRTVPRP